MKKKTGISSCLMCFKIPELKKDMFHKFDEKLMPKKIARAKKKQLKKVA